MLNRSTNNHHYMSDTFAPYETSCSSGSKCVRTPQRMEMESFESESLINGTPVKVTEQNSLSDLDESLFDGLCSGGSSEQTFFSILGSDNEKSEQDLSNILNGIHLGNTLKATESIKKENETNSLSLADLFFKDNKQSNTTSSSSQNEVMKCEFPEQNLFDVLLTDCVSANSDSPYSSLSGDSGFESTELSPATPTLSDLFQGVVLTEEQIQLVNKDKKPCGVSNQLDFQVDLNVTKKDLLTTSLSDCYQPTPGSSRRENRKSKSPRAKPSLFCRVLCSKPKPINVKSIPKLPSTVPELLSELGYYKYFAFDTPSPDDIIKEKQRLAFNKH